MLRCDTPLQFKQSVEHALSKFQSVALITHVNPDGDGLCTCLAWQLILSKAGALAEILVDDLNLSRYDYLLAARKVQLYNEDMRYDLLLIVDVHDQPRLSLRAGLLAGAKQVIVLDHHEIENDLLPNNRYWIDQTYACTGLMLWQIYKDALPDLKPDERLYLADCLYTTVLNDTNNFTNANTSAAVYQMCAELMPLGLKPYKIHRKFMLSRTFCETRLIGQVLSTIETHANGTILFFHCTRQMLMDNGLGDDATGNLSRLVQDIVGVESSVFFREEQNHLFRLSLRSKTRNVHKIATEFGGGGHIPAAGCSLRGTLPELKQLLLQKLLAAPRINGIDED